MYATCTLGRSSFCPVSWLFRVATTTLDLIPVFPTDSFFYFYFFVWRENPFLHTRTCMHASKQTHIHTHSMPMSVARLVPSAKRRRMLILVHGSNHVAHPQLHHHCVSLSNAACLLLLVVVMVATWMPLEVSTCLCYRSDACAPRRALYHKSFFLSDMPRHSHIRFNANPFSLSCLCLCVPPLVSCFAFFAWRGCVRLSFLLSLCFVFVVSESE